LPPVTIPPLCICLNAKRLLKSIITKLMMGASVFKETLKVTKEKRFAMKNFG
jgi:hypothetical protein